MLVPPSIQPKALHETRYNVVAYPFATDYQNSNQWVLEVLAAAMAQAEGAPAIVKREQAQQWLRQQKYQPSVLHIGLGKRVGARLFVANATTTDHPAGERISGNYSVVTVESVFDFLHQRSQLQQELVIPMCRWPVPLPPRPESRKENDMRPLLTSVLSMVIVTGLAWSTAAHAERRIVIIHDPGPQGPSRKCPRRWWPRPALQRPRKRRMPPTPASRWPARSRSSCRRWR